MSSQVAPVADPAVPDVPATKATATEPQECDEALLNLEDSYVKPADESPTVAGLGDTTWDKIRGKAVIYTDMKLEKNGENDSENLLMKFKCLFETIGLTTNKSDPTTRPTNWQQNETPVRRIGLFLFLAGAVDSNNTFKTSLSTVLSELHTNFNANLPRLLVFCRLRDPESSTAPDIGEEKDILEMTEERWETDYPNVSLIYKRGDENNLLCFLLDLKDNIEDSDDPDNLGSCAPISEVVQQLEERNTKTGFHVKGLENKRDLRIEGFELKNRLLENHPSLKDLPNFAPVAVRDMPDNCYENNGDGRVLIIANEHFKAQNRRRGTRIDCENLKHLFRRLGIPEENIAVHYDLKSIKMKETVDEFCKKGCTSSCAILVILTHGSEGRLYGVESAIGEWSNWISVQYVVNTFSEAENLARKPKFLIINACRISVAPCQDLTGPEVSDGPIVIPKPGFVEHYLASPSVSIEDHSPNRAGLIVAYSTLHDAKSHGLAISGSRFIGSLCWVLHHHAGQEDLFTMINRINKLMTSYVQQKTNAKTGELEATQQQLPSWVVQTTKKFYLAKVVAAPNGHAQTGSQELQCPLAALGCPFSTHDASMLADHLEHYTDVHGQLCADKLRQIKTMEYDLSKEREKNRELTTLLDHKVEQ